jgi:N-acetylmuramoyl-L-alanine amidase
MKLIAALAVSVSLLVAQTERPALHSVTAVRHWSLSGVTRVAIEVSGDFRFRSDRLHNPERIYFDILDARPRMDSRRFYSEDLDDKLVTRIRAAETVPGVTRVVLELSGDVEATTSQLANPNRLIIELRGGAPGAGAGGQGPGAGAPSPTILPETAPALPAVVRASPPKVEPPAPPVALPAPPVSPVEIPKAAKHTSTGNNSLTRALGLKVGRIVIDAGHGGHDQGTEGPKGLLEKDLVLDVAMRLGKLIEDRMGAEVIYTRTDDTFIPLEQRTALANDKKADLFLSIHANSSPYPRIAGIETFYLNFSDSKEALDVAARENASSQNSIFELQDIIQKITQHDKAEESKEFAGRLQAALYAFSAHNVPGEKNRGVKKAPFVVLIGASMPSVLAEIGFLSNPREEALLKKPDYRQKLAEALYRGVTRYSDSLSHFQVAQK